MYLPFSFFMPCPEPPMGISHVGSFPVWCGGSLIIFQLFICRNLALNRMFLFYLRGRHVLHLGDIYTPHMIVHPICLYASCTFGSPHVQTTPICPPCSLCASICSRGICMWNEDGGHLYAPIHSNTPICLDASYVWHPPHVYMPLMFSCTSVCAQGYLHVIWGIHPICWGLGGISTSVRHFGVCQYIHCCQSVGCFLLDWLLGCLLCFMLYISCSSLCLKSLLPWLWLLLFWWLWWLVVGHLSHQLHGSFFDRVSCNIGSAWCSSATTVDTKVSWRCYWLCLCATAATSIFDASSGLCQLCHGLSTGRFLFQSWATHCFVYYMFGPCFGVCFLLSGAILDAIFTPGAQPLGFAPLQPLELTCGRHMSNLVMVIGPHQVCTVWLLHPLPWVGGAFCSISCSPAIPSIWWDIQLWGLGTESPDPPAFLAWWGGIFFSRFGSIWWHGWLWICNGH